WDGQSGACLAVLEGHTDMVKGALALSDGRLLSWSGDNTLRLWDGQSGACLAVLEGHTHWVYHALALSDGRLLSWSRDGTLRLWDGQSGACLEVVPANQFVKLDPDLLQAQAKSWNPGGVCLDFFADTSHRCAYLRHKSIPKLVCAWNADSDAAARCLLPDGTAVVTQANDQVCILKLHHGNRRVSLAEAEAILAEREELSVVSDQPSVP
ncbi:MAG: WD40 repeat domain-containing protein, partial [Verrucomicrobia bacterium]|nr:WD40 repeat domain-containing protein [Verrucomicrobiota bacterium]